MGCASLWPRVGLPVSRQYAGTLRDVGAMGAMTLCAALMRPLAAARWLSAHAAENNVIALMRCAPQQVNHYDRMRVAFVFNSIDGSSSVELPLQPEYACGSRVD